MEPRVSNLLLAEQAPADRHETDIHTLAGTNPSGAVFPSTTLPAIRPLHEAQLFDARPYTNEIDSLTLPEIDWHALTASLNLNPPASGPASAVQNAQAHSDQPATHKNKSAKSGAPIAEVLNQVSPDIRNAQRTEDFAEPEARKRRRLEAPVARTLPRPSPAAKKNGKRHLLPPLLVPLHEPPPNAGLIPSMATEGFKAPIDKVPSRETLRNEQQPATPTSAAKATEKERTEQPEETRSSQAAKSRRTRQNWSKEETSDLLRGVAKFGIGNWKKILDCTEYNFRNRTAVDLKDRFRTCCPDEYKKVGSQKIQTENSSKATSQSKQNAKPTKSSTLQEAEKSNKFEHKLPDELARLGISGPFPKAQRRARRGFTAEEDEAILRGFEQYGAKWTKIQSDLSLGLSSRSRTDLRDRFRNKYPGKFIETGHKFDKKDGKVSKDSNETEKETQTTNELATSSSVREIVVQPVNSVATQDVSSNQHSLRLLTSSMAEPNYFPDFGDLTPDTDAPGAITLSRNIFDWADQNTRTAATSSAARVDTSGNTFELSNTITTMDQFHINPMLALKEPPQTHGGTPSSVKDGTIAAPSNLFPQLPLSGILNGPVSLPSTAELVSGLEAEGSNV